MSPEEPLEVLYDSDASDRIWALGKDFQVEVRRTAENMAVTTNGGIVTREIVGIAAQVVLESGHDWAKLEE